MRNRIQRMDSSTSSSEMASNVNIWLSSNKTIDNFYSTKIDHRSYLMRRKYHLIRLDSGRHKRILSNNHSLMALSFIFAIPFDHYQSIFARIRIEILALFACVCVCVWYFMLRLRCTVHTFDPWNVCYQLYSHKSWFYYDVRFHQSFAHRTICALRFTSSLMLFFYSFFFFFFALWHLSQSQFKSIEKHTIHALHISLLFSRALTTQFNSETKLKRIVVSIDHKTRSIHTMHKISCLSCQKKRLDNYEILTAVSSSVSSFS